MSEQEMYDAAMIIGKNIERLLLSHSEKQNELAKFLGVHETTVGKWILGKAIPRMGIIQKIADRYGINKSDLLEDKPLMSVSEDSVQYIITRQSLKDNDRILLSHLGELSDEEQEFFRKQIERAAKERRESYDD